MPGCYKKLLVAGVEPRKYRLRVKRYICWVSIYRGPPCIFYYLAELLTKIIPGFHLPPHHARSLPRQPRRRGHLRRDGLQRSLRHQDDRH